MLYELHYMKHLQVVIDAIWPFAFLVASHNISKSRVRKSDVIARKPGRREEFFFQSMARRPKDAGGEVAAQGACSSRRYPKPRMDRSATPWGSSLPRRRET